MNPNNKIPYNLLLVIVFLTFPLVNCAQKTTYTQFWDEIDLVRTIGNKWAAEIDLSGTFSSTPEENRVMKTSVQRSVSAWVHYYHSPRWKFTAFLGYYYNKDVPEIGQYKAPEWRFGLEGTYYIHKIRYTLNTDIRLEVRFTMNEERIFEDSYRYRQKLKFKFPLNSRVFRKGVVYVIASEEVILASVPATGGTPCFNSNIFKAGGGYLITDDIQAELVYANVFAPRDDGNQVTNAVSVTITINNLFRKIGKVLKREPETAVPEE